MKISFDDTSYIEVTLSPMGKVIVVLSARDGKNPKNNIVNSVEISREQFLQLSVEITSQLEK